MNGRDAIYLDDVLFENRTNHLKLKGDVNSALCSKSIPEKWIPYCLTFEWVLSVKITELDTWESLRNWYNESSFDEVANSSWLAEHGGKVTPEYKHYILLTYDDVVEVICKSYQLEFGEPKA
ncbi:hypothetical protein [Endozoicomonas atrinae]|uniref:hypothetical protein n=1 Tax=Endozoicomonas atrinae TaxID=1333660 RepID=UPI003B0057A4